MNKEFENCKECRYLYEQYNHENDEYQLICEYKKPIEQQKDCHLYEPHIDEDSKAYDDYVSHWDKWY